MRILLQPPAPRHRHNGAGPALRHARGPHRFSSETPIEDIRAESREASAIFDAATGQLAFQVPILSFHFPKALMEEHFNENYMETERHPKADLRGGDGPRPHGHRGPGCARDRHPRDARRARGAGHRRHHGTHRHWVAHHRAFDVPCADHDIAIPKVVAENIAEVIGVTLTANLAPR